MGSITKKDVSATQVKGQEQYSCFVAGAFRGTIYYGYYYRHSDGELFSMIAKSLEECRRRRDEWLNKKEAAI